MVWKFDAAPADLRALHNGEGLPKWVAFIPGALYGLDLEEAFLAQNRPVGPDRYQTKAGDFVFIGSCDLLHLMDTQVNNASAGHS